MYEQAASRSRRIRKALAYRSAHAARAVGPRGPHPLGDWLTVGVMAAVLVALSVVAAVLVNPWWVLCLAADPLYVALPIARAKSDPNAVVELLTS
jgi:hypothetical protein